MEQEYEARFVRDAVPTDCCHYAVVSLRKGVEVCRVWEEADARNIAGILNTRATQSADDALRAENELMREALDMCRCIIKYHVKNAGVCCTLGVKVFSALDAHEAAVAALASKDRP